LECEGCGITDDLVIEKSLRIPKSLGGVDDPTNQIYLCDNCQRRINIIGEKFKTEFKRLSKIGISKHPEQFRLIQKLSPNLKKLLIIRLET